MANSSLKRQVAPFPDLADSLEDLRPVSLIEARRPDDVQTAPEDVEAPRPRPQDEVEILGECVVLLEPLDDAGRGRVLAYINDRFGSRN